MIRSLRGSSVIARFWTWTTLGLALLISVIVIGRPQEAKAHNDSCAGLVTVWWCDWYDRSLPPTTRHWFNADITKRKWLMGQVWDTYTNSMQKKCVAIKDEDGVIHQVACGSGSPMGNIPSVWRPGWMFNYHWADNDRYIGSNATHPRS